MTNEILTWWSGLADADVRDLPALSVGSDIVVNVKFFNTAGPCHPALHYMLPAVERLPEAREFIDHGQYFVVHAPRQTGKTTALATLARQLTAEGTYLALHFSCEEAKGTGDDYGAAEEILLDAMRDAVDYLQLPAELHPPAAWPEAPAGRRIRKALTTWVAACPRPLVLFFDEIDALQGGSLLSVLSQLRAGYTVNKTAFVHSVVLCGLRDVRDYKSASGGDASRLGTSSPFNIKIASLRIGDFTAAEVAELYGQHTAETGQEFTVEAVARAFFYTQGQPWLVNALANEIIQRMKIKPPTPITADHVDQAKERLIYARATHLDSLTARLAEPRIKRVIEPLIAGELPDDADLSFNADASYVRDLGLIAPQNPVRIANPIYKEVIIRVLGSAIEALIFADPRSFKLPDGRLDFPKLLEEFAAFWRKNGEILHTRMDYPEVAPQLILMAFLHRIVNGGGYIDREYGLGRYRIDLLVRQPYLDANGKRAEQCEALELKVWRQGRPDPLAEGLEQLDRYLDRLGLDTGVLAIFDARTAAEPIAERIAFSQEHSPSGRTITLLRA